VLIIIIGGGVRGGAVQFTASRVVESAFCTVTLPLIRWPPVGLGHHQKPR
jgi:hypothetical protein